MTQPPPLTPTQLTDFIGKARWFGGKGRSYEVAGSRSWPLTDAAWIELVEVRYSHADSEFYQLPLVAYPEPQERLAHALVENVDGSWVYDAVHDREAMAGWLEAFATSTTIGPLEFVRAGSHELDTSAHSTLFSGEQSNSSVAFGDDSLMKVFRKVTPGRNPDVEIHRALTEADNQNVAHLYGWLQLHDGPDVYHLAMLQQFLRTATDGWNSALASVRNLLAEADLHADEVGGDFAGDTYRLGSVVAEIHSVMRQRFGPQQSSGAQIAALMEARLDEAISAVPALADTAPAVRAIFESLRSIDDVPTQRVHGDLHLGQTLRTSLGWKLVDFEGEPAKTLAERQQLDSPWRDVAGMLRSFDYAAQAGAHDVDPMGDAAAQALYRAGEWRHRNREAFLTGYAEQIGRDLTTDEHTLINAYEADKAVYEVVYEARNRPAWINIPLDALTRVSERHQQKGASA